jgi:hypothetical protein
VEIGRVPVAHREQEQPAPEKIARGKVRDVPAQLVLYNLANLRAFGPPFVRRPHRKGRQMKLILRQKFFGGPHDPVDFRPRHISTFT